MPWRPGPDGALSDAIGTKRDETYLNPEKQECTRPNLWCVALTVGLQMTPGPDAFEMKAIDQVWRYRAVIRRSVDAGLVWKDSGRNGSMGIRVDWINED